MSQALLGAIDTLPPEAQVRFHEHIAGGTSAEWLSNWLRRIGQPVSATTIKTYRRTSKQNGV